MSDLVRVVEVDTPVGGARLSVRLPVQLSPSSWAGTLALGHGAGGGIEAVDLVAVTAAAVALGWRVALVEQPWRVAGRRVAAPPRQLDVAWTAVLGALAPLGPPGAPGELATELLDDDLRRPLVVGGRSAGARVACRTAAALGATAVLCLAFPLHPPGRPERSRVAELLAAGAPTLVVQGRRDAFGRPAELEDAVAAAAELGIGVPGTVVVQAVDGDHGLTADPGAVADAVGRWLGRLADRPDLR